MTAFRCEVTNGTTRALSATKAPVDCTKSQSQCVRGAKQPIYYGVPQQNFGPNVAPINSKLAAPAYNSNWGFDDGAQHDAFGDKYVPPTKSSVTRTSRTAVATRTKSVTQKETFTTYI